MEEKILIEIAKKAILEEFLGKKLINKEELIKKYPFLKEKGAVFVTLNKNHNLRGCIGSIIAHQSLIDDLIQNAKSAAFADPRFRPLSEDEFKDIELEISLLTPPKRLEYSSIEDLKSKIRVGIDGVILQLGSNQATYLPSVWEQLPNFELFFYNLCQKAGLSGDCLKYHPTIYTYQAKKITDK
jgi:AmmeMemoRadiSam system protein A